MVAKRTRGAQTSVSLLIAAVVLACGSNEYAPPPPPEVTVANPEQRDVVIYGEFTGTTRAIESVEVRARVKGFLLSRHFSAGDVVQKGELLFTIDPESFEIALHAGRAELASAQAELDLSQTELERTEALYKRKATSEITFLQATAARDKAAAARARAQAQVESLELDLDYAHVKAPITGRVGRHQVDDGNLVGAGEVETLTQVVRYSPLLVYFYISERDVLALQQIGAAQRKAAGAGWDEREPTPIEVGRSNDDGYPFKGRIDFTALEIDADTGTYEVRGVIPNEGDLDEIIVPGTFVRVRIPVERATDALLVSERALGADQSGRYLLVVDEAGVVEHRPVQVGSRIEGMRVIEKGLRADDLVIVKGLQRARPGAKVKPVREGQSDEVAVSSPPGAPAE